MDDQTDEKDEINVLIKTSPEETKMTSLKEQILLESSNKEIRSQNSIVLPDQFINPERLDIRDRIRINKEKLDSLLNQNPLIESDQGRGNEESDLPFHSGPLRLSIFRESPSPSPPKGIHISDRYDTVFRSFVKRQPLSENCTRTYSLCDFSSSSDEEVSEPLPESPLNLSDTENMSTGYNSPGLFSRRRNKLFSSSQSNSIDNRPKSLYDSAKPRPLNQHKRKADKGKVSDRLSRLMHFGNRRSNSEEHEDINTYQKCYEPVPPNVTWTNVVNRNNESCLQPSSPTTSPTTSVPNQKKKRHAPDPPKNVAPFGKIDNKSNAENSLPQNSNSNSSSSNLIPNGSKKEELEVEASHEPTDSLKIKTPSRLPSLKEQYTSNEQTRDLTSSDQNIEPSMTNSLLPNNGTDVENINADSTLNPSSDSGLRDGTNAVDSEKSVPMHPLLSLTKQRQAVEELVIGIKASNGAQTALKPLADRDLSRRDLTHSHFYDATIRQTAVAKQPVSSLHGTDLIIRLIVDDLITSVEQKVLAETRKTRLTNMDSKPQTSNTSRDVINQNVPKKQESNSFRKSNSSMRPKSHKHRKSMDNASSGYSSPGSGDEAPSSPDPIVSSHTIPSPTSSYYSTSLSTSSSRVSNLSRELNMTKSKVISENTKTEIADDATQRPPANKTVSNNLVARRQSTDSKIISPFPDLVHKPLQKTIPPLDGGNENSNQELDGLPDMPIKFRGKSAIRVRAKSEYIPYRQKKEFEDRQRRVSICMIEKPTDTGSLSRSQAKLYHQKGSKKALAAAQKSRAFAMRAKPRLPGHRHSYADPTESYILEERESDQTVPSTNLVSHFVSTQDISTYYDGTGYRTITAKEILSSKRDEFFNAYKRVPIGRNSEIVGGSVRNLPVSGKEFEFINNIIHEELDTADHSEKIDPEKDIVMQEDSDKVFSEQTRNTENSVKRQPSEASSSSSGTRYSPNSSAFNESTWSLSGEMSAHGKHRKPSLRRRIQSAFSFQNIRKAISMEKLDEEEKRKSMSHHYLNENGTHYDGAGGRGATQQGKSANGEHEPLRKAPSISSLISSVRMRKRRSRAKGNPTNRYTIADPQTFANDREGVKESKRPSSRPVSMVLSNANRRKLDDVGSPSFFRPIGRVLQMNPVEGTLLVEMVKPSFGPFGFYIARKKESGDLGSVYISRLSDSYPEKMFAGLMRTGDEITEVNGTNVSGLTLDEIYDLILDSEKTLLQIKPSQVHRV